MNEFNPNFQDPNSPDNHPDRHSEHQPPADGVIGMAPSLRKKGLDYEPGIPGQFPPMRTAVVLDDADRSSRLFARLIDGAVFLVGYIFVMMSGGEGFGAALGFFVLLALGIYQIFLLTTRGQTIGKQTMRIKIVVADDGENGGFVKNVLLREILNSLIGLLPFYSIVDVLFIFRGDQRCIHDLIAGTRVVNA